MSAVVGVASAEPCAVLEISFRSFDTVTLGPTKFHICGGGGAGETMFILSDLLEAALPGVSSDQSKKMAKDTLAVLRERLYKGHDRPLSGRVFCYRPKTSRWLVDVAPLSTAVRVLQSHAETVPAGPFKEATLELIKLMQAHAQVGSLALRLCI